MTIFSTLECGSSVINRSKINEFQFLVLAPFWVSCWRCFGSPNGGQGHQKATSKKHQKNNAQHEPKLVPKGAPNGLSWPPPLLQTARTAWKPTRRSPEGLTCRNVAQDMQITSKFPPNVCQNTTEVVTTLTNFNAFLKGSAAWRSH